MTKVLNHKQVVSLIKAVGHQRSVAVEGEAGIGKTAMLYEFRNDPAFAGYRILDPIDCPQLRDGSLLIPDLDRDLGVSRELPNVRFGVNKGSQKGINGSKPVIICLDEFAKCRQFIKDMLAPVFYERRLGEYHLPEGSIVFGCTNLSLEGLGDSLQPHLRDRLITVRMAKPTKDEWVLWASGRDIVPEIIAAAHEYPIIFETFTDYMPGGAKAGKDIKKENAYIFNPASAAQQKWVTPRSLHAASDLIKKMDMIDEDTLTVALEGTIGAPFTGQLMSYIRFGQQLPPFGRVCDEPTTCPVPTNPTAQLVQVFQFVTQVKDKDQAEAVSTYVKRMKNEMQSLFVNTVAHSNRQEKFVLSKTFSVLLSQNRAFFGN